MRHRLRRITVTALALVGLGACASATEPELALAVGLDAREFGRDSAGNVVIPFRVSNAGSSTVFLQTCGSNVTADVERRAGPALFTQSASTYGCFSSLYLGPRRLDPGQTVTGLQSLRLPVGEYRLRVLLSLDPQAEPTRSAVSDVIVIR